MMFAQNYDINKLHSFEQKEMAKYDLNEIYFIGKPTAAKIIPKESDKVSCFSDEKGFYRIVKNDHLAYRYEVLNVLGQGSFGTVVKAIDYKKKKPVAIKILAKKAEMSCDVELLMNQYIACNSPANSKNLVQFIDAFTFRGHKCIVYQYLYRDLASQLTKRDFNGFSIKKVRYITKSILKGLKALHEMNIMHGDLKLKNVVLCNPWSSNVKLIDFGSSRFDTCLVACGGIQTRDYMAPEVLLKLPISRAIDMWGLGCCVYQLLNGRKLFMSSDKKHLFGQFIAMIGLPSKELVTQWMAWSVTRDTFFNHDELRFLKTDDMKSLVREHLPNSPKLIDLLKPFKHSMFQEFIQQCLLWSPHQRLTVQEAMVHKWIKSK